MRAKTLSLIAVAAASLCIGHAFAEGAGPPHDVDTTGLPPISKDWEKTNPYRGNPLALKIGSGAFNENCARCHGLEAISGGIAPDLRYLDKGEAGDAWFLNRIRHGYTQNGMTKMPAFEGILSQQTMWAIRTYLDSRYAGDD